MKLQEQCCTREQGERLVQLGVKPEATFWWMPANSSHHAEYVHYGWHSTAIAPAYNVAELGIMLDEDCKSEKDTAFSTEESDCGRGVRTDGFSCRYVPGFDQNSHTEFEVTEAQARAGMLIYLLENHVMFLCKKCQMPSISRICETGDCI